MARRNLAAFILATVCIAASALLSGCASSPKEQAAVVYAPNYDGIYRLTYSSTGSSLYYRFFPEGVVVSARADAPAEDVMRTLTLENANTSRGTWSASNGELRIGVDEGTVSYESRFDLRQNGRIALRGLPRNFEFIRTDSAGNEIATR